MNVFGPIPSRRLGRSLGINNIPFKHCSYSCVYCQLGRTDKMQIEREAFYSPEEIFKEAEIKINKLKEKKENIDYITYVCDGEPTLDKNLGIEIEMLKSFGIKIAVITNASLLWMDDVKRDLLKADLVSVKLDSVTESVWKKIDRPNGKLELNKVLTGIKDFAKIYKNELITETMLVKDINDNKENISAIADFIKDINPLKAYVLVPTRPPAEETVEPVDIKRITELNYYISRCFKGKTVCILAAEGSDFTSTEDVEEDFLSIVAVHPMDVDSTVNFFENRGKSIDVVKSLLELNKIEELTYKGNRYFRKVHN